MSNVRYMSVSDAVMSQQERFFDAVERGISAWMKEASHDQVRAAFFVSSVNEDQSQERRAA